MHAFFSNLFHRGVLVLFFNQTRKVSYNVCIFLRNVSYNACIFSDLFHRGVLVLFLIKQERLHIMYVFFRNVLPRCTCFVF